jgi:hypothetical protein
MFSDTRLSPMGFGTARVNCRNPRYLWTLSMPLHALIGHQEIRHRDPIQHQAVTLRRLVHAAVLWSGRELGHDGAPNCEKFVVGIDGPLPQ